MDNEVDGNVFRVEDDDIYFRVGPNYHGFKLVDVGVWVEDSEKVLCFISKETWDRLNNHVQANYAKWEYKNG